MLARYATPPITTSVYEGWNARETIIMRTLLLH